MVDNKTYKELYAEQFEQLATFMDDKDKARSELLDLVDRYGVAHLQEEVKAKLPKDLRQLSFPPWREQPNVVAQIVATTKKAVKNILTYDKFAKQYGSNEDLFTLEWVKFAKKYGFKKEPRTYIDRKSFIMKQVYVKLRRMRDEQTATTS